MQLGRATRSIWTGSLLWAAGLVGYHFLITAIYPASGVIIGSTFPLYAIVRPVIDWWAVPAAVVFACWLLFLRWYDGREFGVVPLLCAVIFVFALNVSTAMTRGGLPALSEPFTRTTPEAKAEYLADVEEVGRNPFMFMRRYPRLAPTLSLHSGTHPPGPVLYLWMVSRVFGKGLKTAAWSAIIGTSLALIPFYLLGRHLYGERVSWYGVAIYSVTPSLVLFGATSMDGVFPFFPILATYFFHRSWKEKGIIFALLTGLALAAAMFFTFSTVCMGLIFMVESILAVRVLPFWRQIWRNLFVAGVTFVVAYWFIYLLTGYNLISAFRGATRLSGVYRVTVYTDLAHYFHISLANLAAFLIGTGVVTVALWWREIVRACSDWVQRTRSTDVLQLSFVLALLLLAFSTMFCMETERVLMFLMVFPILAAAKQLERFREKQQRSEGWLVAIALLFAQTYATQLFLYTHW